ncbi:MAG: biotin/lipoyl-containing protein, partial [Bacteroidota bacterium]
MAQVEIVMPKMGESIIEATILKWVKQVGEPVEEDETILEIATDKVDSEVPSPVAGTLVEIRYSEDEVVEIGKVIALIETAVEATPAEQDSQPLADEKETEVMAPVAISTTAENTATDKQRFYSP